MFDSLRQIQARVTSQMWVRRKFRDPFVHMDAATAAALTSGIYLEATVNAGTITDAGTTAAALTSGEYVSIVVTENAPANSGTVSATLGAGEYFLAIVNGGAFAEAASQTASLSTGDYVNVIVPLPGTVANAGNTSVGLTSGAYSLA